MEPITSLNDLSVELIIKIAISGSNLDPPDCFNLLICCKKWSILYSENQQLIDSYFVHITSKNNQPTNSTVYYSKFIKSCLMSKITVGSYFYGRYHHRIERDKVTGLTLPATNYENIKKEWYKFGKLHRDDRHPLTGLTLPAVVWKTGTKEWYKNGLRHNNDRDPKTGMLLPAKISGFDHSKEFWIDGEKITIDLWCQKKE